MRTLKLNLSNGFIVWVWIVIDYFRLEKKYYLAFPKPKINSIQT